MDHGDYRPQREALVPPGGVDAHARDMTVTVAADVTLGAVQAKLAEHQQWLPIDGDAATAVGRLVEVNSTGPLRLGYGAWRDLLLGVQFHNGRGEMISAGGRTVKNVAGYDLAKFMVGQRGIFGTLVTVTARTWRRPAGAILATLPPQAAGVRKLLATALRPQWAILTPEALLLGYLGDERAVDYYAASLAAEGISALRRTTDEDLAHRERLWRAGGELRFRAAVPPTEIELFVRETLLSAWVADAAFGIVRGAATSIEHAQGIAASASRLGGTVAFDAAYDGLAGLPPAVSDPVQQRILTELKKAFDPEGRLRPLVF
mgnify:CR=1 FL=1